MSLSGPNESAYECRRFVGGYDADGRLIARCRIMQIWPHESSASFNCDCLVTVGAEIKLLRVDFAKHITRVGVTVERFLSATDAHACVVSLTTQRDYAASATRINGGLLRIMPGHSASDGSFLRCVDRIA